MLTAAVVTAILKNYCTSSPSPAGLSLQGSMALLNLVLSGEDRDIRVELALQRQAAESIVVSVYRVTVSNDFMLSHCISSECARPLSW